MPETAHVKTPGDREGIIRLATDYMGWRLCRNDDGGEWLATCPPNGPYTPNRYFDKAPLGRCWNPFESPTDAHELESAIPEAKRRKYASVLIDIVGCPHDALSIAWACSHATPRQRSQAALAVLTEQSSL